MPFRMIVILIFIVFSCSEGNDYKYAKPRIGDIMNSYSSNLSPQRSESNYFYNLDEATKRMSLFQKEPFKYVKTLDLDPSFGAKSLLASPDAKYALVVGDQSYGIWHDDGRFELEPIPIAGELQSASYLADEHLMVLQGSFRSIVFIQFTETGAVEKSRVMGPMLESERLLSGTLVAGGYLLAGTSMGRLLKVDVASIFSKGEWIYEEITKFEDESIKWVAKDTRENGPGHIWVYAANELRVMDPDAASVVETFDLSDFKIIGFSSLNIPHMILRPYDSDKATTVILYASSEGGLEKIELDIETDGASLIDAKGENLILTNVFSRIRLADGLVTDSQDIPEREKIVFDDDYYFRISESALGMAEKWEYGENQPKDVVSRFYFDEKIN